MKKKVLFIGSSGTVGSLLSKYWKDCSPANLDVTFQYRKRCIADLQSLLWSPLGSETPFSEWHASGNNIDTMVVFAGIISGTIKDLKKNSLLASRCINLAHKYKIPRLIIASSSSVYGEGEKQPLREIDDTRPSSAYGRSKLAMEQICHKEKNKNLDICCLRIGNIVGADALSKNILTVKPGKSITIEIFEDGKPPERSYIGPITLCKILESLILKETLLPSILNVGAPKPIDMIEIANGFNVDFEKQFCHDHARQTITLDCTRLTKLYQFSANETFGLDMVNQFLRITDG